MNTSPKQGEKKKLSTEEKNRLQEEEKAKRRQEEEDKKRIKEEKKRKREEDRVKRLREEEKAKHRKEKAKHRKEIVKRTLLFVPNVIFGLAKSVFQAIQSVGHKISAPISIFFKFISKILLPVEQGVKKIISWFARHPKTAAFSIFSFLTFAFFFKAIFLGQTYLSPDAQAAAAMSKSLDEFFWKTLEMPLWSPYVFCGMPSFASLMYAPFVYMPGLVLLPFSRLFSLPTMLSPALHYIFAAMGVFVFLRRKDAAFWPAILGGFAFMFTPYLITMQVFGHGSQMMTSAYLPWALWAVDRLIKEFSLRNVGLAALILGFQLQRGHVQISYYILMLVGFYLLYQLFWVMPQKERDSRQEFESRPSRWKIIGGFIGALVLAAMIAAVLYGPLREYTPYSIRGTPALSEAQTNKTDIGVGFEYATQWSFSPREMMTFLVPSFYGFGDDTYWGTMPFTNYPNYMGILVLILAIIAIFYRRNSTTDFLGFTALIALFISFGKHEEFFPFGVSVLVGCGIVLYLLLRSYNGKTQSSSKIPTFLIRIWTFSKSYPKLVIGGLVGLTVIGANTSPVPLYWLLYHLPIDFNKFRVPVMILIVVQMSVAILAGLGLQKLIDTLKDAGKDQGRKNALLKRFQTVVYLVIGLMILVVPAVFYIFKQESSKSVSVEMFITNWFLVVIFVVIGFGFFRMSLQNPLKPAWLIGVLLVLTIVDLGYVDYKLNDPQPMKAGESSLALDKETIQFLQADTFRIYPIGQLFNDNRWAAHKIQSIGGYHPAKPRDYQNLLDESHLDSDFIMRYLRETDEPTKLAKKQKMGQWLLDLLNVKYIVSPFQLNMTEFSPPDNYDGPLNIYENKNWLPRAYLAGALFNGKTIPDKSEALKQLLSGDFNPHESVIINTMPDTLPQPDPTASIQRAQYDLNVIKIETKCAKPQILVLSDNFYPEDWQAYRNDDPVEIYRANYCFRAVYVPRGAHKFEFRCKSAAFSVGWKLTLVGFVGSILLIAFGGYKKSTQQAVVSVKAPSSSS